MMISMSVIDHAALTAASSSAHGGGASSPAHSAENSAPTFTAHSR
eukprot:COSAG01_NODE_360_length_18184_cov_21.881780_6_plen_45_part_00